MIWYDIRRAGLPSTRSASGIWWRSQTPLWQPRYNSSLSSIFSEVKILILAVSYILLILMVHTCIFVQAVSFISFIFVVVSTVGMTLNTMPSMRHRFLHFHVNPSITKHNQSCWSSLESLRFGPDLIFGLVTHWLATSFDLPFSCPALKSPIIASGCDPDRANILTIGHKSFPQTSHPATWTQTEDNTCHYYHHHHCQAALVAIIWLEN